MIKVKPQEISTKNWVRNSIIKSYLRDENQPLSWIIGIIRDSNLSKEELKEILDGVSLHYGTTSRFQELQNKLKELHQI